MDNWKKEIFNYFDYGRYSNAVTETLNGIIKKVNRAGNGYQFEVLRAKMLYGAGRSTYTTIKKKKEEKKDDSKYPSTGTFQLFMPTTDYGLITSFGVDIDELERRIDDGSFFEVLDDKS